MYTLLLELTNKINELNAFIPMLRFSDKLIHRTGNVTTVEIEPRYRSIYPPEQCGFGKPDYSSNGRCHGAMHAKATYADV